MRPLRRNFPAYLQISALRMHVAFIYRANLAIELLGLLLKVYLLKMIFVAVYAGREAVGGVTLQEVITFMTIANLQGYLLFPAIGHYVRERLRDGQIALDLMRPAPLLSQLLAYQAGTTVSSLPFVALAVPFAALFGGIELPQSLPAGLLYLVSLGLGYVVSVLMGLLIGLVAFWTMEIDGIFTIYAFANQFFGGALVPLWFFPPLLRRVAEVLPFQAQTFIPLSIYTGQLAGGQAMQAITLQAFWVIALSGVAWLVWQRAMQRVVIQGG
jgi:viologen exporter family transport system permease protein